MRLSTIVDRAFPVAVYRVWNSLFCLSVTSAPSLPVIGRLLKTALFARSYDTDYYTPTTKRCIVTHIA